MRTLATFVAVLAGFGFTAGFAEAGPGAKLKVVKVSVSPGKVAAGGKVVVRATVKNRGKRKAKARLSVRIDPSVPPFASRRIGKVKARSSKKVRLKLTIPGSTYPTNSRLRVCASPGKFCRDSKTISVFDNSGYTKIEADRAAGRLTVGKALLYEMYALSADKRLPKQYRGPGDIPSGTVFADLSASFATLSAADQAALFPYTLQPRYRQSAWFPGGIVRAAIPETAEVDCKNLNDIKGAWTGIKGKHAWFWYRPGRGAAKANAKRLSKEFEKTIWPKLISVFGEVNDASGAVCDPSGDSKIDVYLVPPGGSTRLGDAHGVTPPQISGSGCGPSAAFIQIKETEPRSTLAHEFMHAIQWNYKACERHPAWIEGTAAWAENYVYPKDQREHEYKAGITLPFISLLANGKYDGYQAWPFWFSLEKKGGVQAIKDVFNTLATENLPGTLEAASPEGLRKSWERYSRQRWNQVPVGATGFPESKSFKAWDSLSAQPGALSEDLTLGGAPSASVDLLTSTQAPLSTFFSKVKVTDKKARHIEFVNADVGLPGSMVLLFIKLASGKWRYEDVSARRSITFCRDQADQNLTEMVVATSNASPRGAPLGAVTHRVTAKNTCGGRPESFSGSFSGNATYDSFELGTGNSATATWSGSIKVVSSAGSTPGGYPAYFGVSPAGGGSVNYKVEGNVNDCELDGQTTLSLAELSQFQYNIVTLTDATTYSIGVPFPQLTGSFNATYSNCDDPGDNGPAFWTVNFGVPSLVVPVNGKAIGPGGGLTGNSSIPAGGGSPAQTTSWSLTPGG